LTASIAELQERFGATDQENKMNQMSDKAKEAELKTQVRKVEKKLATKNKLFMGVEKELKELKIEQTKMKENEDRGSKNQLESA